MTIVYNNLNIIICTDIDHFEKVTIHLTLTNKGYFI